MLAFLVRASGFALLLVAIGAVAFAYIVRTSRAAPSRVASLHTASARIGALCALALVPVVLARLYVQLGSMRFPDEPLLQSLGPLMTATFWGPVWGVQLMMCGVAAAACFRAERAPRALVVAAVALILVAAAFSLSGHAASPSSSHLARIVADTVHIVAAGTWLGALTLVAWVVRALKDVRETAAIVHAFTPVALVSAGVLAFTGAFASFAHVPTLDALWLSAYGRLLMAKLACVGVVIAAGWFNWKRHIPRIADDNAESLRRGTAVELGAAFAALLVTTALVVTPLPSE